MRIAVYQGPGVGVHGLAAIKNFLNSVGLPWGVLTPTEIASLDVGVFTAFWLPGGWAGDYLTRMPARGKAALRRFVESGGAYVGTCAGAYFAADRIVWEGEEVAYDLNLYHGRAEGSIHVIARWKRCRLTTLHLSEHPANGGYSRVEALYWGGPQFCPHADQPVDVLAVYEQTRQPAIIAFPHGDGRVLLMGPHLELGYDEATGMLDYHGGHGAQWGLLNALVRWTLATLTTQTGARKPPDSRCACSGTP